MTRKETLGIAKDDVLVAWIVLENLAVSFDQIGATYGDVKDVRHASEQQHTLQEALQAYLTPALVQAINETRIRLGQYISDEEAEAVSEHILYWDYAAMPKRVEDEA
jgi:hypothetical protein